MANYLYNGVELPDINTVWTDKETYPYAVFTEPLENNSIVALYLTGAGFKFLNDSTPTNPVFEVLNTGEFSMYFCALNEDGLAIIQSEIGVSSQVNEFVLVGTTTQTAGSSLQFGTMPLWTSNDILNTDGSVYLAASDPVPVSGSKLTISAGGESSFEYALYNGLKLPKLPEWDKEAYPYAAFDSLDLYENDGSVFGDESLGLLWRSFNFEVCTSRPEFDEYWVNGGTEHAEYHKGADFKGPCSIVNWSFEYDLTPNGRALLEQMGLTSDLIDASFNQWIEGEPRTLRERESTPVNNETNGEFLLWSNTDILKEDGSLYFAGSEPVPVASDSAVTDTTATVNFECKDLIHTDSVYRIKAWVYKVAVGIDTTLPPTWASEIFSGTSHSESHTFTGLIPATDYAVYGVIWSEIEQVATEHNATATFRTLDGEVITPDFSDTSLYVENLEFTTNAADFDIGWMNLPETMDLNHVQYFISAELDDGTTTTNSTVYLFSSDMVEDGTHWFSFTALKPNTEYTLTAKLLYNTTGAFSDFTDSGISVTFDFTTEASGFDRDSFLLGFTSGLCQTAATKTGAEYHNWMQGYIVGRSLRKVPAYSADSM